METGDSRPTRAYYGYTEKKTIGEVSRHLENNAFHVPSLEEVAQIRLEGGPKSYASYYGCYVRDAFVHDPQRGIFLTKNSPIMPHIRRASKRQRSGKEFYLTDEQTEEALANSVQFKDSDPIPTNRFAEDERTRFAFGKVAEDYGKLLEEQGIHRLFVFSDTNLEERPLARPILFLGLGDYCRSAFYACNDLVGFKPPISGKGKIENWMNWLDRIEKRY